jgi:hypothetical protein
VVGQLPDVDARTTAERQLPSGSHLVVGAQEGDDLADGPLVGQHAGVALVRVQAQAASRDALGRLPEQLRGVEPIPTAGDQQGRGSDAVQQGEGVEGVLGGQRGAKDRIRAPGRPSLISSANWRCTARPWGDSRQAVAASTSRRTMCGWSMANC